MGRTMSALPAPITVLDLPTPALVVLVGASSSGKSAFAARHFGPEEVVSPLGQEDWLAQVDTRLAQGRLDAGGALDDPLDHAAS